MKNDTESRPIRQERVVSRSRGAVSVVTAPENYSCAPAPAALVKRPARILSSHRPGRGDLQRERGPISNSAISHQQAFQAAVPSHLPQLRASTPLSTLWLISQSMHASQLPVFQLLKVLCQHLYKGNPRVRRSDGQRLGAIWRR